MKGVGVAKPFTFTYKSGRDELSVTFTAENGEMVMTGDYAWPVVLTRQQVGIVGEFVKILALGDEVLTTDEASA